MRTIPAALQAHYQLGTLTLATLWKVTLTNGTVYGFTDHDVDITTGGLTYLARSGFAGSAVQNQTRLAVDNLQINGLLDSSTIVAADLAAGLWDFAEVQIALVNWASPGDGVDVLMRGHLGEVSLRRGTFVAELRALSNAFAQAVGELYSPTCRARLGDARCGISMAAFTVTGTLSAVSADGLVLTDPARTEAGPSGARAITGITQSTTPTVTCPAHGFVAGQIVYIAGVAGMTQINGQFYIVKAVVDANNFTLSVDTSAFSAYTSGGTATAQGSSGYFDYGKITMTSGASNGLSMEVKAYSPGTITLQMALPRGVAAGDTYSLQAGCGHRFIEDCVTRFANGVNFRGEPHVPGLDKLLRTGGQ